MRIPYPLKRVLSPFHRTGRLLLVVSVAGDTEPFSTGLGNKYLSFPEREGGPAVWLVDRSSLHFLLRRTTDCSTPPPVQKFLCYRKALLKTPYPQAGPFPLFHGTRRLLLVVSVAGDTKLCPSLKGKGDRCALAQWWIGFYTDHSTLYYYSGGGFLHRKMHRFS